MYGNTKLAIVPTLPSLCDCEKHDLLTIRCSTGLNALGGDCGDQSHRSERGYMQFQTTLQDFSYQTDAAFDLQKRQNGFFVIGGHFVHLLII